MTVYDDLDYQRIGAAIAAARRAAGLSQHDLAATTGLNRSSIANCEAGRQRIPSAKLAAIAERLGTTTSELLGERTGGGVSRVPTVTAARLSAEQREISRLLGVLAEPMRELRELSLRLEGTLAALQRAGSEEPAPADGVDGAVDAGQHEGRRRGGKHVRAHR